MTALKHLHRKSYFHVSIVNCWAIIISLLEMMKNTKGHERQRRRIFTFSKCDTRSTRKNILYWKVKIKLGPLSKTATSLLNWLHYRDPESFATHRCFVYDAVGKSFTGNTRLENKLKNCVLSLNSSIREVRGLSIKILPRKCAHSRTV